MPVTHATPTADRSRFSAERLLFVAAAVILVLGSLLPLTSYLSPKNGLGYGLGVVGGLMLLLQSLYAIRKKVPALHFLGSVPAWFQWHIQLGVVAPVLVLIHCGFSLGAANSTFALFAMLLVAVSGLLGRYLSTRLQRGSYGRASNLEDLLREAADIKDRGSKLPPIMPELLSYLTSHERQILAVGGWTGPAVVIAPLVIATRHATGQRALLDYARHAIQLSADRHRAVAKQQERFERLTFDYITRRLQAGRQVAEFRIYERLFSVWHLLHVPLFLLLIAATVLHVVAVHLY